MRTMQARVQWLRDVEGGRQKPPSGEGKTAYSALVRFSQEPWPTSLAWSLTVEKIQATSPFTWIARIHFLAPDAPEESLSEGMEFELYEGKKRVATGHIESPVAS